MLRGGTPDAPRSTGASVDSSLQAGAGERPQAALQVCCMHGRLHLALYLALMDPEVSSRPLFSCSQAHPIFICDRCFWLVAGNNSSAECRGAGSCLAWRHCQH
jgi:hypothetical protein